MLIKIAARHSDLARIQAIMMGNTLKESNPDIEIEYFFRASLGDKNLTDPLWKLPEQGVFTQDFYEDLVNGEHDMVVHSWKDLPVEERKETEIFSTLKRADMRDLFLLRKDRLANIRKSKKLNILSSSPRRAYNLSDFFRWSLPFDVEEVNFESVRGNVPTRIKKFLEQDVDGMIVAKAAFDRLLSVRDKQFKAMQKQLSKDLSSLLWQVLPLTLNPAAAAQGALAVEIRRDREDLKEVLKKINCSETKYCAEEERRVLSSYGGGCHQKIGVSLLEREFALGKEKVKGRIKILKGLTDAGVVLDEYSFTRNDQKKNIEKTTVDKIFPREFQATNFFKRESLDLSRSEIEDKVLGKDLFIARSEALPKDFLPDFETITWAAGLKTWKALAKKGVWVYGSAEGLGEKEDSRIGDLLGRAPEWLKLTHQEGFKGAILDQVATYKLIPKEDSEFLKNLEEELKNKTHFYWKSASSCFYVKKYFSEVIAKGIHACGPGNTYMSLQEELPNLQVFLNYQDWKKEVIEK